MRRQLLAIGASLGCDPELFFKNKLGRIVGSERVIPEVLNYTGTQPTLGPVKVVRDGVQVELHPLPFGCRANFSDSFKQTFQALRDHMAKLPEKYELDFRPVVRVTKSELARLSEKSRVLGCQPSFNLYGIAPIETEGLVQTRVAGGHIHIGSALIDNKGLGNGYIEPTRLVRLLDILVGVPGVLMARNPDEAKRRIQYGRAGEYRLPNHGLEYRTLSNFWLRSYPLFSLIFGNVHLTNAIAYTASDRIAKDYFSGPNAAYYSNQNYARDAEQKLLEAAPIGMVVKAIQENDFDIASQIYRNIRPILNTIGWHQGFLGNNQQLGNISVENGLLDFEYFVSKGLDHWWPPETHNIMNHWADKPDGHGNGWESWSARTVQPQRLADKDWKNPFIEPTPSPAAPAVAVGDLRRAVA